AWPSSANRRSSSATPAPQRALREEIVLELLVEPHIHDLDRRAGGGHRGLDLHPVGDRNRADRADVALANPLLRRIALLEEVEPARHQVLVAEPEQDPPVADVLAVGRELDDVVRRPIEGLSRTQARPGVGLGPTDHLLEQVEIVVAEIAAHEALVACARRDLPDPLQLGEIEPLLGQPALVRPGVPGLLWEVRRGAAARSSRCASGSRAPESAAPEVVSVARSTRRSRRQWSAPALA